MPLRREALAASIAPLAGCLGLTRKLRVVDERRPDYERPRSPDRTYLGFAGDLQLGRSVSDYHRGRPQGSVWGSMLEPLRALDGLFANLECVVSNRGERWPDKTFHFRADPGWALPALGTVPTSMLTLANNHAMDFGAAGLFDAIENLAGTGIARVGAGAILSEATAPAIVDVDGLDVAAIGLVDHWSDFAAGPDSPGTAYAEPSLDDPATRERVGEVLERARAADPDLLVASLHWGSNYELEKGEDRRAFGRWLVDEGVDVVHGHGAHVLQGVEVHRGRPIVYDAGDFLNDYAPHEEFRNDRTFLFELVVGDGPELLRLVPVEIGHYAVERARPPARRWLREQVLELSAPFGTTIAAGEAEGTLVIPLGDDG